MDVLSEFFLEYGYRYSNTLFWIVIYKKNSTARIYQAGNPTNLGICKILADYDQKPFLNIDNGIREMIHSKRPLE